MKQCCILVAAHGNCRFIQHVPGIAAAAYCIAVRIVRVILKKKHNNIIKHYVHSLTWLYPLHLAARSGPASSALQSQQSQCFPAAAAASAPPAAATVETAAPAASATAPPAAAVPAARPAGTGTAPCQWGHHPVHNADPARWEAAGSHRT